MPPNLFCFATSELSQDAFLCWLLAWADQAHTEADPALHRAGLRFVRRLAEAARTPVPSEPFAVEVKRQFKDIDVLALVGNELVILIEDKTHTSDPASKLKGYKEIVEKKWPGRPLAAIYLKTGDQADYVQARQAGYAAFTRRDLINVLLDGVADGVDNAIFIDFLRHLQNIEANVQSWQRDPLLKWSGGGDAWKGFYLVLQEELGEGGWSYVPNPSGGFMGFYWCWRVIPAGRLYLQLEEQDLCVKIEVGDKAKRGQVRNIWSWKVTEAAKARGLPLRRPKRFGNGQWMTVAVWDGEYREVGEDDRIDLDATVARLRGVMALMDEIVAATSLPTPSPAS